MTASAEASSEVIEGEFHGLKYSLSLPERISGETFPLLLILHGMGGTGANYLSLWREEADRRRVIVVAPTWNRAYRNTAEDLEEFRRLADFVVQRYPVDSNRVYLAGLSAGGTLTEWILIHQYGSWKAGVVIAGANSPGWTRQKWISKVRFPKLLFIHGDQDKSFPSQNAVEKVNHLRASGVSAEVYRDPNAGHEHRPEWNDRIFDWLLEDEN